MSKRRIIDANEIEFTRNRVVSDSGHSAVMDIAKKSQIDALPDETVGVDGNPADVNEQYRWIAPDAVLGVYDRGFENGVKFMRDMLVNDDAAYEELPDAKTLQNAVRFFSLAGCGAYRPDYELFTQSIDKIIERHRSCRNRGVV